MGAASMFGALPSASSSVLSSGDFSVVVPESLPPKVFRTESVGISRRTHEEHLKLWQGYAKKTNEIAAALKALDTEPAKANQIYSQIRALKVDFTFAYEGFINHEIYFDTIGGSGGPATGAIGEAINNSYGTFANWLQDWKATGLAGRGWAFLCLDKRSGRVFNYMGDSQNTYPVWNHECVLAMDVYEHAYYLDFQTKRASYIDAYARTIDWEAVNRRFAAAVR